MAGPYVWADVVLAVHFLYVLGVALPVPLVAIGRLRGWSFVRNNGFRNLHLAMIAVVLFESAAGLPCPLTLLELHLRHVAGQTVYGGSCVHYWVSRFCAVSLPESAYTAMETAFGLLVIALYIWAPPRWLEMHMRHAVKRRASDEYIQQSSPAAETHPQ